LSDPDECRTAQFTWTWEQRYCSAVEDAGVTTSDAATSDTGAEASTDDASEAGDAPAE
jgi:hypothetical protein